MVGAEQGCCPSVSEQVKAGAEFSAPFFFRAFSSSEAMNALRCRCRRAGTRRRSAASTSRPRRSSASPGWSCSYGADMLWFPVGYTAGYLVLLVLVAAPLRRSGAYTLPDFAEARLESAGAPAGAVLVVGIGWLYLLPQFQGAGLALQTVTGAPPWVGGAGRRRGRRAQRRRRGHALDHVRAGVPVLAEADRLACPRSPALARTRRDSRAARARLDLRARVGRTRSPGPAAATTRCTRRTASCSRSASARWGCRTCSSASTPTPTDGRPAAPPWSCSALLGAFYLFPAVLRRLGRLYRPTCCSAAHGRRRPAAARRDVAGPLGEAAVGAAGPAGAFAAFLSTSSGLTVSVAGVLSTRTCCARLRRAGGTSGSVPPRPRGGRAVLLSLVTRASARRRGGAGVRGGGVDVLPAARARHLVARAHRPSAPPPGWSPAASSATAAVL